MFKLPLVTIIVWVTFVPGEVTLVHKGIFRILRHVHTILGTVTAWNVSSQWPLTFQCKIQTPDPRQKLKLHIRRKIDLHPPMADKGIGVYSATRMSLGLSFPGT